MVHGILFLTAQYIEQKIIKGVFGYILSTKSFIVHSSAFLISKIIAMLGNFSPLSMQPI